MLDPSVTFVSLTQADYRALSNKAMLGKVLGRNIERAAAAWALLLSPALAVSQPTAPYYDPILRFMPLPVWAWMVGAMSAARVVVLIVNGWWPITFQVRIGFSIATLLMVWSVLAVLAWVSYTTRGAVYPTIALAPLAATIELLCFLSLRTRLESVRQGVADDVGYGAGGGRRSSFDPAAGLRERLGEAARA